MIGKKVIQEKEITLSETRTILERRKKDLELSYEQKMAYDYVKEFGKGSVNEAKQLVEELMKIEKIDEHTAVLIANNKPATKEELKIILEKKRFNLSDAEVKKILDLVAKHK